MDKQQTYNEWLTEDFLLDEIERTPELQMRLERLYDYLQLKAEYEEELEADE
jgi:hypothetical protein